MTSADDHASNKRMVVDGLRELAQRRGDNFETAARQLYSDTVEVRAFCPVDECSGLQAVAQKFWQPLINALPDVERRDSLVLAGQYDGRDLVACLGHWQGTFREPLFDIPPTNDVVAIRYGEVHVVDKGKISASYLLADMLDLMRQADCVPIAPSVGTEAMWPEPNGGGGVLLDAAHSEVGAETLRRVREMHAALGEFDGRSLDSMPQEKYWAKKFMWYGPSGIGTTRGLDGFRAHHQIPFLRAFPDRVGGLHYIRIGDGSFAVTGGWPSVRATHSGSGWLAMPASGKPVGMRVMDFYRCDATGMIAENWVPIDVIDILRQLGVDVFARMRHLTGDPELKL